MPPSTKPMAADYTDGAHLSEKAAAKHVKLAFPAHGFIGILFIGIGWYLAWAQPQGLLLLWENAFIFLWGGYIFTVDGLNVMVQGHSLLSRNARAFIGLFVASLACWWLFEFLNIFINNWLYIFNRPVTKFEYAFRASIHFTIVTPAVLETAELWHNSKLLNFVRKKRPAPLAMTTVTRNLLIGIVWLALVIGFPRYAFPLAWGAIFLILDAINYLNGIPSIHGKWAKGDRKMIWSLALGSLTCGFFWEMWNYHSIPKWIYQVPFVDFWHVFEMPVLGYLGYLPFGLEVFALYFFTMYAFGLNKTKLWDSDQYVRL
jgi:hypothetical protein